MGRLLRQWNSRLSQYASAPPAHIPGEFSALDYSYKPPTPYTARPEPAWSLPKFTEPIASPPRYRPPSAFRISKPEPEPKKPSSHPGLWALLKSLIPNPTAPSSSSDDVVDELIEKNRRLKAAGSLYPLINGDDFTHKPADYPPTEYQPTNYQPTSYQPTSYQPSYKSTDYPTPTDWAGSNLATELSQAQDELQRARNQHNRDTIQLKSDLDRRDRKIEQLQLELLQQRLLHRQELDRLESQRRQEREELEKRLEKEQESLENRLRRETELLASRDFDQRLKEAITAEKERLHAEWEARERLDRERKHQSRDLATKIENQRFQLDQLTKKYDTTAKNLDSATKQLNSTQRAIERRRRQLEDLEGQHDLLVADTLIAEKMGLVVAVNRALAAIYERYSSTEVDSKIKLYTYQVKGVADRTSKLAAFAKIGKGVAEIRQPLSAEDERFLRQMLSCLREELIPMKIAKRGTSQDERDARMVDLLKGYQLVKQIMLELQYYEINNLKATVALPEDEFEAICHQVEAETF